MKSVLKSAAYVLINTPDMIMNGATQTTEMQVNPGSEYLKKIPEHIRSYEDTLGYAPNQTYIGNMTPSELTEVPQPWFNNKVEAKRYGSFGEIMPQEEFLLLMQACDAFDLVHLNKEFVSAHIEAFKAHPLMSEDIVARVKAGVDADEIAHYINDEHSEALRHEGEIVGYVKRGHDVDVNLSAHVMHENIVAKASCTLSLLHIVNNSGIDKSEIDYVIDCCEEAVGDMNQRGGGNMAKAAAEIAGFSNASGSDLRAFCAAPLHAMIQAASLVAAGTYKNVVVAAGGCTAKLGMNGKDHVKKDMPILEDMLGGIAFLISADDGINPIIDTSIIGKHSVGTGSSPQNVMSALVYNPLEKAGLAITDIDKYAAEMHNPEITKPAGAGDVPLANYKMIAALAVTKGQIPKTEMPSFPKTYGMTGWAPTQGHIPSGAPYFGFCRNEILAGEVEKAMVIGKGSLFLGRMTNLFDGVSVIIRQNEKAAKAAAKAETAVVVEMKPAMEGTPKIAITGVGSELGEEEVMAGAVEAASKGADVVYIGTLTNPAVQTINATDDEEAHAVMEKLLAEKQVNGAVTMHFPFPIGVTTIGKFTAANGKEVLVASTTGTSDTDRVRAMVKNAVYGIAAAKACGIAAPTVGILNLDGARQVESTLKQMKKRGYAINMAESTRADGGCIMRGNDVLAGACDIIVTDSLSGNVIMKLVSAFTSGGEREVAGSGYGPGIGEGFDSIVNIVSRASGSPVIAGAILYCGEVAKNGVLDITAAEIESAKAAGLDELTCKKKAAEATEEKVEMPPKEVVTASIAGVDTLDLEEGAKALWKAGIYAETGMGCTGPIILISEANAAKAQEILQKAGFLIED